MIIHPVMHHSFIPTISLRYSLMMSCWAKQPNERPCFSDIVTTISNYTEAIAGYLEVNFSPFSSTYNLAVSQAANSAAVLDSPDTQAMTVSSELPSRQLFPYKVKLNNKNKSNYSKGSPKLSAKPYPRASTCAPPRISTSLMELRKMSTASNAAIEIRIESPSEDKSIFQQT